MQWPTRSTAFFQDTIYPGTSIKLHPPAPQHELSTTPTPTTQRISRPRKPNRYSSRYIKYPEMVFISIPMSLWTYDSIWSLHWSIDESEFHDVNGFVFWWLIHQICSCIRCFAEDIKSTPHQAITVFWECSCPHNVMSSMFSSQTLYFVPQLEFQLPAEITNFSWFCRITDKQSTRIIIWKSVYWA